MEEWKEKVKGERDIDGRKLNENVSGCEVMGMKEVNNNGKGELMGKK